jgi:hypothetical protein
MNDEFRMTNDERNPNDEIQIRHSSFVIHSDFDIRHLTF